MEQIEGLFCKVFGNTPRNKILEFFLEIRNVDYGIADIARNLEMNKATAYNISAGLIKQKILIPARTIGKTQTYKLNKEDFKVKMLMKTFDNILKKSIMVEEKILLN